MARTRKRQRWTPEEDAWVRKFHAEGKNDKDIAYIIGRTRRIVSAHRHQLGLPTIGKGGNRGYHHTPEAKARIGAASRKRHQEKAANFGWSAEATKRGLEKINKTRFRRPPPGRDRQIYNKLRDNLGVERARQEMGLA